MNGEHDPCKTAAQAEELLNQGNVGDAMMYFWHAARVYTERGDWIQAAQCLEKSAYCYELDGRFAMAVVDYSNAAGAYLNAGDEKRAREARNRAESLEMETGFSRLRHVIGAVGLVASGKDALIERLSTRFGIPVLSTGDITRDLAEQDGLGPPTRDTLHAVSKTYIARFGPDYFPRRLIERIAESDWETVSITGLRTPEDIRALRDHFGDRFILVYVEVTDDSLRFERARMRGTARDPKTIGELKAQDQAEEELFHLSETFQLADVKMNNDGPLEEFYEQIDGLAQNLGLSPK